MEETDQDYTNSKFPHPQGQRSRILDTYFYASVLYKYYCHVEIINSVAVTPRGNAL